MPTATGKALQWPNRRLLSRMSSRQQVRCGLCTKEHGRQGFGTGMILLALSGALTCQKSLLEDVACHLRHSHHCFATLCVSCSQHPPGSCPKAVFINLLHVICCILPADASSRAAVAASAAAAAVAVTKAAAARAAAKVRRRAGRGGEAEADASSSNGNGAQQWLNGNGAQPPRKR